MANLHCECQAPVVQTMDSAVHWINHYPADNSIGFASVYLLDSDLTGGHRLNNWGQELKPNGETNSSFLVHPSSGVHTVKTVGSHLNPQIMQSVMILSPRVWVINLPIQHKR